MAQAKVSSQRMWVVQEFLHMSAKGFPEGILDIFLRFASACFFPLPAPLSGFTSFPDPFQ